MAGQGSVIINGQKVEGRTLSFDSEGVKVGDGNGVKVVVPNSFDFAEGVEDTDFEDYEEIIKPKVKITVHKKNCMIAAGVAVGIVAGLIIGGVIYKKKRG